MESPNMNVGTEQSKLKVSISARLMAAFAYLIPAIGGALSSLYLMDVMRALRNAESAGIGAVMAGLSESTVPALGALYLAAVGGFIVIIVLIVRMIMQTKTASPASWFFVLCGFLFLVPAGLFFEAESMIIEVLTAPVDSTGIAEVGSNVRFIFDFEHCLDVVHICYSARAVRHSVFKKLNRDGIRGYRNRG